MQDTGSRRKDSHEEPAMYLYKVEAEMKDGALLTVVLAAESDAQALTGAENHLLRYTVATPSVDSLSLVEKKPLQKGTGYVIPTAQEEGL